jgi:predicted transcriptional regulator of viral defense system
VGTIRDARRRLFLRASRQGGYFTAAQAVAIGYSHQAQAHHVAVGNWVRVDRGIFRLADWVPEPHDEYARWRLWSRDRGAVSHESALAVHGIGQFETGRVHLSVPRTFTMTHPALILHKAELGPEDIAEDGGFAVTTPLRTIIDIAADAPDLDHLARMIESLRERGLLTPRALRQRAEATDLRAALYIERALALPA